MTVGDGTVKTCVRKGGYHIALNGYTDDMRLPCMDEFTIVKVYGYAAFQSEALEFNTEYRPLLWERKEETKPEPKKLTVAEIEKELGYSVEIVSEGE